MDNTKTNNWQKIETAPKDGTLILMWNGDEQQVCSWYCPGVLTERYFWAHGDILDDYNSKQELYGPTHWMPLPPPPAQ